MRHTLFSPFQIHTSSVISMLHSEIKTGLKSAFRSLDGPLFLTDWCKGRSQLGELGALSDGSSAESSVSECRESSNAITLSMMEPMSPQTSVGGSSSLKGSLMSSCILDILDNLSVQQVEIDASVQCS